VKLTVPLRCVTLLLSLQAATALAAQDTEQQPLMQVFLGVAELDDQTGRWDGDALDTVDVDFSSLPVGGIELEYVFARGFVHWGLNPGGSVAWKDDNTQVAGSLTEENGGTLLVEFDNSLLLAELHLGGYVRGRLAQRITTYAAAGPMVMYGSLDVNHDNQGADSTVDLSDDSSSDINLGFYGRAGIDFAIDDKQQLGLGVRYLSTELDFDQSIGNVDIKGPQYVLTFSVQI